MQATAVAHPNVALIKYWGKQDVASNFPAVGSLSLTLDGLCTRTTVRFDAQASADRLTVNGQPDARALARVSRCLDLLRNRAGVSSGAMVESVNDFPTGAGLASSASGYAALVKAAAAALKLEMPAAELDEIARLGSGSAPRSLHGGIVLLDIAAGEHSDQNSGKYSNQRAAEPAGITAQCRTVCTADEWPLSVLVAVTSRLPKDVGSTGGMELSRDTSPYYRAWVDTHPADLQAGLTAVSKRDFAALADLSEHSCLKMHAVAMSSQPALIYWSGATVECIRQVRELRQQGLPVFFTIDAGPQLKAVCLPEAAAEVRQALLAVPGVLEVIDSGLGRGAWVEDAR